MKKVFTILLFFCAIALMSFVMAKDEPMYKNLKILPKDITKDQMDSVMHHFAASMGKKCGFCHVYNQEQNKMDFASDAKEQKETARAMWQMQAKLNKKFFEVKDSKNLDAKLQVTCFTCHHGSEHPETAAPMKPTGPPPGAGAPPQGPPPGGTDSTKHQ